VDRIPRAAELFAICVVGGMLAVIAALPSSGGSWDAAHALLAVAGVVAFIGGLVGVWWTLWQSPDRQARALERARTEGRGLLDALRSPDDWREFLDFGAPRDLLRRIERWEKRTRRLVPARDHEKWDRIWTSNMAEPPRSHAPDDLAFHRRDEWQWRMLRAVDLLRRLLNETGPARPETDPEHVRDRILRDWEDDESGGPTPPAPRSPRRTRRDR